MTADSLQNAREAANPCHWDVLQHVYGLDYYEGPSLCSPSLQPSRDMHIMRLNIQCPYCADQAQLRCLIAVISNVTATMKACFQFLSVLRLWSIAFVSMWQLAR